MSIMGIAKPGEAAQSGLPASKLRGRSMRLPLTVALLAFACVLPAGAAQAQGTASPSGASSTSSPSAKTVSHRKKHHAVAKRQPSQKAPTADRITEIQSALARGGYYQGDPSGKWDPNTVAAVGKFQSANGIDSNGKLDAPTLQKLGLGSDIAGVSAPKPVARPSCCSTTPAAPPSSQSTMPASTSAVAENSSAAAPGVKPLEH
jgi:peptidoglycan hydrolase-like protein with peptidoglycan-binding domain